jgi:hypothetical protein
VYIIFLLFYYIWQLDILKFQKLISKKLLFILLPYISYSQNHIIIDSSTKRPIPYTNVKFVKKNKGFYGNYQGRFTFNKTSNDSIQISCLGYNTLFEKVNLLKDTIFLTPKIESLNEIVIYSVPPSLKTVGFKRQKVNFHTGSNLQFGLLLKPIKKYENTFINNILIPIKKSIIGEKKRNFTGIIKISVFSNKNNLPYESLLETPIIIKCNQDSDNYINVDISKEFIKFDSNGIFFEIEIVGETDSEGSVINREKFLPGITFTNKMSKDFLISKSFYKYKFSNNWKEMKHQEFHLKKEIYLAIQLVLVIYENKNFKNHNE